MKLLSGVIVYISIVVLPFSPLWAFQGNGRGKPPLVTACYDKSVNDSCSFISRSGDTVEGKCQTDKGKNGEEILICKPNRNNGNHQGKPPILTACEDKEIDAPCSFTTRRGDSVDGVCQTDKGKGEEEVLICKPNRDNGGHQGKPPVLTACDGKNIDDSCSFTSMRGETVDGVCQTDKGKGEEEVLICKPNRNE